MFGYMRKIGLFLLPLVLLSLLACNEYERILKGTNTRLQYEEAMRYYGKGKWNRASELFAKVLPMVRATSRGDSVMFMLSDCYYQLGDYDLAGYSFGQFVETYPKSTFLEVAMYQAAYCNYLASPRPALDQSNTQQAISDFMLFKENYPESEKIPKVNEYIQEMYAKLETKSYEAALLYYKQEKHKAAVYQLKNSLEQFPTSPYREREMYMAVESWYLYALNSIVEKQRERYQQTLDAYLSFVSEFPDSEYMKDATAYYRKTMKALGKTPSEPEEVKDPSKERKEN